MQDLVSSIDACASARPVNAANGVPGEGRQFQLQPEQGRQRTTARPGSRTRTPPASPAEIRFIDHMAWRKRCDRAFASWSLF